MNETMQNRRFELSSFALHLIAMAAMLCDHIWATIAAGQDWWLTGIGRIAFPIFAFMIVEGYFHTHDLKKYLLRLLGFALISEIPFNLMYAGAVFYPFHQNVMWTFLIALGCIALFEKLRARGMLWLTVLGGAGIVAAGTLLGFIGMVDYYGFGVMMVFLFYAFRGRQWYCFLGQLIGMYWINVRLLGGMMLPVTLFGREVFFTLQGLALFALIPIWLYRGRKGPKNRTIQFAFYAFYPVHMLILYLIPVVRAALAG